MKLYLPFILLIIFCSCVPDQEAKDKVEDISLQTIHQDLIHLQFLLLSNSEHTAKEQARTSIYHINRLSEKHDSSAMLAFIALEDHIKGVIDDIDNKKSYSTIQHKMDLIRDEMINLSHENGVKPFYNTHWNFESKLLPCIDVSQDQMLDLYEWKEFELFVDCMNSEWKIMKNQLFDYENLAYNQTKIDEYLQAKSDLNLAIENFNLAVYSDLDQQVSLCEMGEVLNENYINYLGSLVPYYQKDGTKMKL